MRNAPFVADLECSGCARTLVKDGCLKCTRCGALIHATLGEKRIYCPNCSSPRVLLARHDEALCPESKSRCQNRKGNKGTPMKLTISEETEMTTSTSSGQAQEAVATQEQEKIHSKTQELRDWLDAEIKKSSKGSELLAGVLRIVDCVHPIIVDPVHLTDGYIYEIYRIHGVRYGSLILDERDAKIAEDRKKLEETKERLELLRSARELDVDIDAMEEHLGVDVRVEYHATPNPYWPVSLSFAIRKDIFCCIHYLALAQRTIRLTQHMKGVCVNKHELAGIKSCTIIQGWRAGIHSDTGIRLEFKHGFLKILDSGLIVLDAHRDTYEKQHIGLAP